jgi:nitroreductase
MTVTAKELNELKKAQPVEGVMHVFHERWSPRSFADREVSPETLAKVFEAARWAASSGNAQPWRYLVGVRGSETHQNIFDSLVEFNQKWAGKAPVLILGYAQAHSNRGGKENRYALYDLGASTAYLVLEAAALGLTTHQMGGYDQEKARAAFEIPAEYVLGSVIALGYQDHPDALGDKELIEREVGPRQRKPLSEFVFSAWGEPAKLGRGGFLLL